MTDDDTIRFPRVRQVSRYEIARPIRIRHAYRDKTSLVPRVLDETTLNRRWKINNVDRRRLNAERSRLKRRTVTARRKKENWRESFGLYATKILRPYNKRRYCVHG